MGVAPDIDAAKRTTIVPFVAIISPTSDSLTLSGEPIMAQDIDLTARVISNGQPHRFEGLATPPERLQAFLSAVPFNAQGTRRLQAPAIPVAEAFPVPAGRELSTQHGCGMLMHALAKGDTPLARRIVTTSPDVTISTNLGAWVYRRVLFAREEMADTFRTERIPSTFHWRFSPAG